MTDSLLELPGKLSIKAFGENVETFEHHVTELVLRHVDASDLLGVSSQTSRGGKYRSVTIDIWATDRAQLDAIYQALTDSQQVVMAL